MNVKGVFLKTTFF